MNGYVWRGGADALGRIVVEWLLPRLPARIEVIVDDTLCRRTGPQIRAEKILALFSHRWDLEVTFRDLKQVLGLAAPQNGWWRRPAGERSSGQRPGPGPQRVRARRAVECTVPFVLCVHAIVVLWYLEHGEAARDVATIRRFAPWRRRKRAPSFADMLAAMRAEILRSRLSAYPLSDRVPEEVLRLATPLCGIAA